MPEPRARGAAVVALLGLVACGRGAPAPIPIETGHPCAFCRMIIADTRLAGELVAPGEEPRQYDDLGCLVADLRRTPAPETARAFVADYQTGVLVPAGDAIYTRLETIATPMASHLVAHATDAARDADPRVRGGHRQTAAEVFGAAGPPGGSHGR